MHYPPEVRFLVGSSPWPRRLVWMLSALALLQVGWFSSLNWKLDWQMVLVGVCLFLAVAWAWLSTQRPVAGVLRWDGQQWQWSGFAGGECLLQRHLDFQTVMLVSLHRLDDRPAWLWLQRSQDPQQWLALRRAVVHSTSLGPTHRSKQGAQARPIATP